MHVESDRLLARMSLICYEIIDTWSRRAGQVGCFSLQEARALLARIGDVDRPALDAELRHRLAEEAVYPEHVEAEFERVMAEVFRRV